MLNKQHGCSLFKSNKHQWLLNSGNWMDPSVFHPCAKGENRSSRNGLCIHAAGAGDSTELTLGQYMCDSRGRFAAA